MYSVELLLPLVIVGEPFDQCGDCGGRKIVRKQMLAKMIHLPFVPVSDLCLVFNDDGNESYSVEISLVTWEIDSNEFSCVMLPDGVESEEEFQKKLAFYQDREWTVLEEAPDDEDDDEVDMCEN